MIRKTNRLSGSKRQLDHKLAEEVEALGLKHFAFQKELKRHYPMGNLFAHVIGFTDIDGKGQEGLELSLEDSLHAEEGAEVVLRDRGRQYCGQFGFSA